MKGTGAFSYKHTRKKQSQKAPSSGLRHYYFLFFGFAAPKDVECFRTSQGENDSLPLGLCCYGFCLFIY